MKKTKWPGNWKFACQRCGFWFPSSEIKKEWTGLMVCEPCWEPKHPQLMIKVRPETAVPDYVSKDGTDQFVAQCDIWDSSALVGFGSAGCMVVGGNTNIEFLIDLFNPVAIAGYAIAGRSIPGVITRV